MNGKTYVVVTNGLLPCDARCAWEKVCFYEHISVEPSWLLRTVLPVPVRTTGAYRKVGDVSRCQYSDGGYLTKRIRTIGAGAYIEFDIIEQSIRYAESISLKGGTVRMAPCHDGACSVEMLTRYELKSPWLRLARVCIDRVISAMHQIVIRDMRMRLAPRGETAQTACLSGNDFVATHNSFATRRKTLVSRIKSRSAEGSRFRQRDAARHTR